MQNLLVRSESNLLSFLAEYQWNIKGLCKAMFNGDFPRSRYTSPAIGSGRSLLSSGVASSQIVNFGSSMTLLINTTCRKSRDEINIDATRENIEQENFLQLVENKNIPTKRCKTINKSNTTAQ